MKASYVLAAMLIALPAVATAQSEGVRGRWSVTFAAGTSVPAGGEFHEGGTGTVLSLPTTVDEKKYSDIFDAGIGWRAGAGYGVSRRVEVFGDFTWERADASELSVGNVASLDLRAAYGEYRSYGIDGGMRFHVAPDAAVSPYMSILAGFRRVDAMPGTFRVPAAGVTLPNTPFYDDSTVPAFGGDVGILFAVSQRVRLGVEGGVRYHTGLKDIDGLAGTGLENLNDAGSRWSVPVSGVIRFGM